MHIRLSCLSCKTCGFSVISRDFTWDFNDVCCLFVRFLRFLRCFQDIDTAARIVLYDWQRGRIPYFTAPPELPETEEDEAGAGGAGAAPSAGPAGRVPTEAAIAEIPCVHVFDEEDVKKGPKSHQKSIF